MKVQSLNYSLPQNTTPVANEAPKTPEQPKPPAPPTDGVDVGKPEAEKDWTVLFYLNGNNAQAGQLVSTMRQLEFIGSTDNIHMAAQLARPQAMLDKWSKDWSGVRRYEIKNNGQEFNVGAVIVDGLTGFLPGKTKGIKSPVLQELDAKTDMGKQQTLQEFLEWGVQKFPRQKLHGRHDGPV
jgi:hypothetical protein